MTVRFKGISEYNRKYGARSQQSISASPHFRMQLAGLRSDQLGISREPKFQTKRRVSFYPSQVSRSLQWGGTTGSLKRQHLTRPDTPPAVTPLVQANSGGEVETPQAPRPSKPTSISGTTQTHKEAPGPHTDKQTQERPKDRINYALRKKAGIMSQRQRSGWHSSEYQRQFPWKTPVTESPLLAAQQMLYSSNRSIPPFKSHPLEMETEYRKSFKGSPPPRPPRLRRDVELNEVPAFQREPISREKSKRKSRREQRLSRKSDFKVENPYPDPQPLQQELSSPHPKKSGSPKVVRKLKTEYSTKFRSPLQYCYRDGVWVRSKKLGEDGHEWYHEVQELRAKAEAYRKRAWGTHFSRQHLSQILSEQNCLWEASSGTSSSSPLEEERRSTSSPIIEALDLASVTSVKGSSSPGTSVSLTPSRRSSIEEEGPPKDPILPVNRKLAWEERSPCERIAPKREQRPVKQPNDTKKGNINGHLNSKTNLLDENEHLTQDMQSANSSEEGRLPTPKMKTMLAAQRTHHDRTTPVTGGAILVSPLKTNNSTRKTRRSEAPLGKSHSSYGRLNHNSSPQTHSKTDSRSSPHCSPTAGLATADPLPLRDDTCVSPQSSPEPRPAVQPHKPPASPWITTDHSPRANRIQGTLRDPEFQHNGNLGLHRPEQFVPLSSDSGVSDNDDRMSQISYRSASSCSMASQVLERAKRRKEEFWGKR